jgi:hypothetical protein
MSVIITRLLVASLRGLACEKFGTMSSGSGRDSKNFQKLFSEFMSFLKILEIILGLPKKFPDPEISKSLYF